MGRDRVIPNGTPPLTKVITEAELSKRMAYCHDAIRVWEQRVDTLIPTEPTESYAAPPYDGLETHLGHLMMFGEIDATEAYHRLGSE